MVSECVREERKTEGKATGERLQSPKSVEGWLYGWAVATAEQGRGHHPFRPDSQSLWEILGWTCLSLIPTTGRKGRWLPPEPHGILPGTPFSVLLSFLNELGIDPSVLCLVGNYSTAEVSLSLALSGKLELALNLLCSTGRP